MFQRIGFIVLLLGAASPSTTCLAKPADLPGNVQQQCPEGRDGQHADGFTPRPDAADPALPRADVRQGFGNRSPLGRSFDIERTRPQSNPDFSEEQEAPPTRSPYREPSERRGTPGQSEPRLRDAIRRSSDDVRRQEMLRSTQPLDTVPQRPADDGGTLRDEEMTAVPYSDEVELPPVQFTKPSAARQTDAFDDLTWLPPSTRENLRSYAVWATSHKTAVQSFPPVAITGIGLDELVNRALDGSLDSYVAEQKARAAANARRGYRLQGVTVTMPIQDCCGREILLSGRLQPNFLLIYPNQVNSHCFVDHDGPIPTVPLGDFEVLPRRLVSKGAADRPALVNLSSAAPASAQTPADQMRAAAEVN